ncbi:MAG: glutathione S-transferase, partial [Shimia sp.]|nr:glutathione S-transferase [Shimia sp.]
GFDLISEADGPFKQALDRTKYHTRYPDLDREDSRDGAMAFLNRLEPQLADGFLFGARLSLADMAILPFVRQFAFIDKTRFDADAGPQLSRWLETFLISDLFATIMPKLPKWIEGDAPTVFQGTISQA